MLNWTNNQNVSITNVCLNIYLQNEKIISLVKICLGEETKTWTGTCLSRYLPCYLSLLYSTESRHFLSDFLLSLTFWCYFSIRSFVSTMKKIRKILRNKQLYSTTSRHFEAILVAKPRISWFSPTDGNKRCICTRSFDD